MNPRKLMSRPLPPKKEVALALLERSSVHVHLDPRVTSVIVPPWFKSQPQLVLQVGLNMPVPIPDLHLDEDGLSCTLSFNRSPFHCVVPWASVFAMVGEDGRGMVWPDDVPVEVSRQTRPVQAAPAPKDPSSPADNGKAAARRGPRRLADASTDDASTGKKGKKAGVVGKRPRIMSTSGGSNAATTLTNHGPPEEPRARLSAVPSPPQEGGRLSAVPQEGGRLTTPPGDTRSPLREVERDVGEETDSQPLGSAPPSIGAGRPKKELPPYLRVVK